MIGTRMPATFPAKFMIPPRTPTRPLSVNVGGMLQYSPPQREKNKVLARSATAATGLLTKARRKVEKVVSTPEMPRTLRITTFGERIGDRLKARFGAEVDIKYIYNVLDLGYREDDLNWMVADGVLTLSYQSSGYFTPDVPDLGVADLPYLFPDVAAARAAFDGRFGQALATTLEAGLNCRVLGYFEAGFSQFSNALRPVHAPADMKGMRVRVRPGKVQARTFELLGAEPRPMDLSEFGEALKARTVDAQENPFANTVTYDVHKFHRFHTVTNQHYQNRQVFVNRASFDAWP